MSDLRKNDLAKIHIAKKQLGLDDQLYRDLLRRIANVESAAQLDQWQRVKVLNEFQRLGWLKAQKTQRDSKAAEAEATANKVAQLKRGQVRLAEKLWAQLYAIGAVNNPTGLNAYVYRMTKVERIEWANSKKLNVVIEGLKAWVQRVQENHNERG